MAKIDPELDRWCRDDPDGVHAVVITLAAGLAAAELALVRQEGMQEIEGLDGLLTGRLTGRQILALAERPEIAAIVAESDIEAPG